MKHIFFIFVALSLLSCVNVTQNNTFPHSYSAVDIEPIFEDPISIRAIKVTEDHIFFAGSDGKFGYLNSADHSLAYMGQINYRGRHPEFRSVAMTNSCGFMLSVGNPGLLYRVNYFGKRERVYREMGEKVFYDSMAFWDNKHGIAIGDPTANCMSVLLTDDGGETWSKVPCTKLPKAKAGEAAFAASNTNIALRGKNAWFISGGKTARIYHSADRGKTWEAHKLPIVQGKNSIGPYSISFYNDQIGYIIGGDYTQPDSNQDNKLSTVDGGKTWQVMGNGRNPGYKSCVKYVPNSNGKELVAMGFTGISYSADSGKTWVKLSDKGFYTFDFMNDYTVIAAGKNNISKITFKENSH